jgi:pyruvate/2-oxoglutarate dehydrogenase complex dihydrolipoamide dehydrogenase (E3) component
VAVPKGDSYEILVIGSGESGKYLAWTLGAAGHRTAVIEQKLIGGSCPKVACLPSKNIIHSAKVKALAGRRVHIRTENRFDQNRHEGCPTS